MSVFLKILLHPECPNVVKRWPKVSLTSFLKRSSRCTQLCREGSYEWIIAVLLLGTQGPCNDRNWTFHLCNPVLATAVRWHNCNMALTPKREILQIHNAGGNPEEIHQKARLWMWVNSQLSSYMPDTQHVSIFLCCSCKESLQDHL